MSASADTFAAKMRQSLKGPWAGGQQRPTASITSSSDNLAPSGWADISLTTQEPMTSGSCMKFQRMFVSLRRTGSYCVDRCVHPYRSTVLLGDSANVLVIEFGRRQTLMLKDRSCRSSTGHSELEN